jgi:hypothetical protein
MDQETLDRYLDSLAHDRALPRPVQVWAEVQVEGTDALAEDLNARLREIGRGPAEFFFSDGRLTTFAKVRGYPWDLHDFLSGLRELSARIPLLPFRVFFEDGDQRTLRAGKYKDLPFAYLDAWVARFPRPNLAGPYSRCTLRCQVPRATAKKLHKALEDLLPRLAEDGLRVTITGRPNGFEVVAEPDTPEIFGLVADVLACVFDGLITLEEEWSFEISFDGQVPWRRSVAGWDQLRALELMLWTGLRSAPQERTAVAQSEAAQAPFDFPRLEGVAEVLQGEELWLEAEHFRCVWLRGDGTLAEGERPPRWESPDGRFAATFVPVDDGTSRVTWLDRATKVKRALSSGDPAYRHSPPAGICRR